jgi:DNA-binding IclR family transcriptional regulator
MNSIHIDKKPHAEAAPVVKSAARVFDVFGLLVHHPDGLSLTQISDALAFPKSSTHGLLTTMVARGYLREGLRDRTYRLGPALFELGSAYIASTDLVSDGWEIVRATSRACNETVHLAVLDGCDVLYVAKEESRNTIRMVSAVGKRFPAYATGVGKILLANYTGAELSSHIPDQNPLPVITPRTITDITQLHAAIDEARQRGYAIDIEESTVGLCCVAAPVYDATGQIVAGMSVSVPSMRFTPERQKELLALITQQANTLSTILGYRA